MLFEENPFFQLRPPARRTWRKRIETFAGAERRGQPPAQMRRTGFAARAVSEEEDRTAGTGRPQAEPSASGEIEDLLVPGDIGHHGCHRLAGQRLFGRP